MAHRLTFFAILVLTATTLLGETTRYMVVTRGPVRSTSLRIATSAAGTAGRRVREFTHVDAFAADLTAEEAAALRRLPDVESVHPVVPRNALEVELPLAPNASPYASQLTPWGITAVNASPVWSVTRGEGVNVAVLDSGIELSHPDLQSRYSGGYNVIDPTKAPIDDHGHGTHVAGTILAADNAVGVVGVAPAANLWAVKILNSDGLGTDEALTAAMDWVISKKREIGGPWVVNMSIGSWYASPAEARMMERAAQEGIVLIAAAGNDNVQDIMYPAKHPTVLAVGALDSALNPAAFTNYGIDMDIAGPGVDVASTFLAGRVRYSDVETPQGVLKSFGVTGAAAGSTRAKVVDCKWGRPGDFPSVAGRIAVIERGPAGAALYFGEKARNAKEAGAVAVVIYNDTDDPGAALDNWTLIFDETNYQYPLTVSMNRENGLKLLTNKSGYVRVTSIFEDYGRLSGTSMATPHVVGTAALLLSLVPNATRSEIKRVLERGAADVHFDGWDLHTGWGLVDALEAAKLIAPERFGTTPTPPSRQRSVRP